MSNKNKWIIGISVFVVVVLAAVLLFVMLGDIQPASGNGDGNTTQDTAGVVADDPSTDPSNTDPSNTDPSTTDPSTTTEPETTNPTTVPPTTEPEPSVEVDVDVDDEDDDEDTSDDGVIDFDDLIAAAGK